MLDLDCQAEKSITSELSASTTDWVDFPPQLFRSTAPRQQKTISGDYDSIIETMMPWDDADDQVNSDKAYEIALRPKKFEDFAGQDQVVENLKIFVSGSCGLAARKSTTCCRRPNISCAMPAKALRTSPASAPKSSAAASLTLLAIYHPPILCGHTMFAY